MEQATIEPYAAGYEGFQIPWWLVVLEGTFDVIRTYAVACFAGNF